jgi:hypothetical protein
MSTWRSIKIVMMRSPANDEEDGEEIIDYNEDGTAAAVEAAAKEDRLKNLRKLFATNGKEYRTLLKSEKVKDLFTSTMTFEMSAEDILSEIPKEELHNVGMVKGQRAANHAAKLCTKVHTSRHQSEEGS